MEENLPLFHIAPSKHSRFLFRLYRFWYGCKNYKELKFSQREFYFLLNFFGLDGTMQCLKMGIDHETLTDQQIK